MERKRPVLLLALLAACAGEDGEAGATGPRGEAGGACTVKAEGGAAIVTCADGTTSTIAPESCSVTQGEGAVTIACPEQEPVVLRDGERLPRAPIAGSASLFGLDGRAGIEVTLVEQDLSTETDEAGRFAFEELRPGIYALQMAYPGYATSEVKNLVVLGASVEVEPVVLKRGQRIAAGMTEPILSADGERLALFSTDILTGKGDLRLVDPESFETIFELEEVDSAAFAGRYLVAERGDAVHVYAPSGSKGWLYDVEDLWQTEYGLYLKRPAGVELLSFGNLRLVETRSDHIIDVSRDSRFGLLAAGSEYEVLDARTRTAYGPVTVHTERYALADGTGRFAGERSTDDGWILSVLDPVADEVVDLAGPNTGFHAVAFSADGEILVWAEEEGFGAYDFATGERLGLATTDAPVRPVLFPNGRLVAHETASGFVVAELETGTEIPMRSTQPVLSASGRWAVSTDQAGVTILDTLDLSTREIEVDLPPGHRASVSGETFRMSLESDLEIALLDAASGTLTVIDAAGQLEADGRGYAWADAETGVVQLLDPATGTITSTELVGEPFGFSVDAGELIVMTDLGDGAIPSGTLWIFDRDDGAAFSVDEEVTGAGIFGERLFYLAGTIDIPGGSLPIVDVDLYLAELP